MSVYVDDSLNMFGRMKMCHMIADTLDELHAMADAIGMNRSWFQGEASTPHYDVSLSRRELAIKHGAVSLGRREFVGVLKRLRGERIASTGPDPSTGQGRKP